jgi:hypothetical protein
LGFYDDYVGKEISYGGKALARRSLEGSEVTCKLSEISDLISSFRAILED